MDGSDRRLGKNHTERSIIVVLLKKERKYFWSILPPDLLGPFFSMKVRNQIFPLLKTNGGVKPDVCQ